MNQNIGLHSIWVDITTSLVFFVNFVLQVLGTGILFDEKDSVLECGKHGKCC